MTYFRRGRLETCPSASTAAGTCARRALSLSSFMYAATRFPPFGVRYGDKNCGVLGRMVHG